MPGPARRLEITDKAKHPAPERLRRFDHARTGRDRPERAKSQPEARTARAPSAGAYRGARTDRRTSPRQRYAPALRARRRPERARSQPEARTARAPSAGAYRGARTDRRTSPRQRYAPALRARRRPERARSQPEAQNAPGASQKPRTRQEPARSPHRARAVPAGAYGGARTAGRSRPQTRSAPALRARRRPERARSQPQAPTARYFASARSPIRSGFDCDARALRNCNSTRPSCARRRRRSASVIGCGRPAWSHRMHSSFVRVGFSFLLHVHAGRYGCSASGFHSLTSSRSRNRSSSVRE
jgi:hypothetical protein